MSTSTTRLHRCRYSDFGNDPHIRKSTIIFRFSQLNKIFYWKCILVVPIPFSFVVMRRKLDSIVYCQWLGAFVYTEMRLTVLYGEMSERIFGSLVIAGWITRTSEWIAQMLLQILGRLHLILYSFTTVYCIRNKAYIHEESRRKRSYVIWNLLFLLTLNICIYFWIGVFVTNGKNIIIFYRFQIVYPLKWIITFWK